MILWTVISFAAGAALATLVVVAVWQRRRCPPPPPADPRILEISELAGGLAHEIRNPLSTLLLNLKLLDEDLGEGLDEESDTLRRARLRIGTARSEGERLQRLLDEFMLLARPVGLRRTVVDLNAVVDQLADFFMPEAQRHGITLRPACAPQPVFCSIDAQVFEQAVLNLLINAQQAMPAGGEIILRASNADGAAVLEVTDTGCGMSPDVLDKATRPFFSTKPGGSGLGLSTTSRIVAAHGGTLQVHSEPGVGSRFSIRLPLAAP